MESANLVWIVNGALLLDMVVGLIADITLQVVRGQPSSPAENKQALSIGLECFYRGNDELYV